MINHKKVVGVLPAYNAAKTLKVTNGEIDYNIVDEVILVNDKSKDQTIKEAQRQGTKHTISHEVNKGYGDNQKSKSKRVANDFLFDDEKIIFYSVLIINIAYLWFTRFFPTMDGPTHLYNSNLIRHLLLGNSFISEFYQINSFPVPNWTTHFVLSFFRLFLPGWLCEKFLIILYVSGMALSFRYLVKSIKPDNIALSVFIFPFIYSFLFHLGFYNYVISFIFLFLTLGYWVKNYKANQISLYVVTGILLMCTYFSNVLTYAFSGITIGSIIFLFEANNHSIFSKRYLLACLNRIKRLTLCSLPSLILLLWFFKTVSFPESVQNYASSELFKWTNDVRSLIVFSYAKEEIITEQFFHILLFLLLFSLFINKNKSNLKEEISTPNNAIAFFPLLLSIVLLFALPDGSSAGMMSDRLSLLFYILLIIVVITQTLPRKVQVIFSAIIITLHIILITKHSISLKELDNNAITINEASNHMKDNTIVLPVNLSDNWLQPHFSNYLGTDKPVIILENYEANVGWFPLQWNPDAPTILLGDKKMINGITWHQGNDIKYRQIDYIFLFGYNSQKEDKSLNELNEIISSGFILEYESEDKYARLYKRKSEASGKAS